MWFQNERTLRTRGGRRRRRTETLTVRLHKEKRFRPDGRKLGLALAVAVLAAGILAALWLGAIGMGRLLFSRNPRFRITRIETRNGGVVVRDFLRGRRRICEGTNIFGFSLRDVQRDFLAHGVQFSSMELVRRLPGTLEVRVVERVPLARIESRRSLVVDRDGWVFGVASGAGALPVIMGGSTGALAPGRRVDDTTKAALAVLDVCNGPAIRLRVDAVDVSRPESLVLRVAGGRAVRFAWKGMGQDTPASRRELLRQLEMLVETLQSARSSEHDTFDATYADLVLGQ